MSKKSDLQKKKRWYNHSYKPALDKLLKKGEISKYHYNKLNEQVKHLEDKRYK